MEICPEVIDALLAEGVTATQLGTIFKVALAKQEELRRSRRAADAARQRASREKRANRRVTRCHSDTKHAADAPPNDIYSNPPQNPCETNVSQSPSEIAVVQAWNSGPAVSGAKRAARSTPGRRKAISVCIAQFGISDLLIAIANLAASEFHCGGGPRRWRASLDWLLKPENCLKMIEAYDPSSPVKHWSDDDKANYLAAMHSSGSKN